MNDDSEKNFENADIIIPHFPGGGELSIGFGSISKIYSGKFIIQYPQNTALQVLLFYYLEI